MSHGRAKLTPVGRALLVDRVLVRGWRAARAAEAAGVSRATVYKWVRRYQQEGLQGLQDRSSAPRRCPHALPPHQVHRIIDARNKTAWGPHRLGPWLGHPRSTVYGVLRGQGAPRLRDLDRPTRVPIRYEKSRPGELVHIDVKKLGRIPAGGGWRALGRSTEARRRQEDRRRQDGRGYDFLHAALDDHTRLCYVEVLGDERGETCAGFLRRAAEHFGTLGIPVEAVMTDNAKNYVLSRAFAESLGSLQASHVLTRPWRPQSNGKVERFNRTMLQEWAYARLYRSNEDRSPSSPGGWSSTISAVHTPRWEESLRPRGCKQRRWELQLAPSMPRTLDDRCMQLTDSCREVLMRQPS